METTDSDVDGDTTDSDVDGDKIRSDRDCEWDVEDIVFAGSIESIGCSSSASSSSSGIATTSITNCEAYLFK